MISFVVVCLASWSLLGTRLSLPRGRLSQALAGAVSGFLTGFGGIGGPPLVLYILSGEDSPLVKRALIIVISGAALITAIISMSFFGLLAHGSLESGVLLAPTFLVGGAFGARLFHVAPARLYRRVALVALAVLSVVVFAFNVSRTIYESSGP